MYLSILFSFFLCLASAQSASFDAREATIESVHNSIFNGNISCRDVALSFLSRIEVLNNRTNAIISLDPTALATADRLDALLSSSNATGSLFCIPVLLKDNYNTASTPTTAGNLALGQSRPSADAPVVAALKNAGAIILGKANLHELALEGLSVSSLGGQTFNPYDSTRTPGGSSGGSGAAVAASFSVFATGTDTVNSLRSPPSANSLFSIRPTRGLITRRGIVPISYTQDVVGPIARTIKDVAAALNVMASVGFDAEDNATALIPPSSKGVDYTESIGSESLSGLRFGLLTSFFNRTSSSENDPVNDAMDKTVARLRAEGATIVPINETIFNVTAIAVNDVQRLEYREAMDAYLSSPSLGGQHPSHLSELYSTNSSGKGGRFLVIPGQYEYVNTALISSTSNATYSSTLSKIQDLKQAVADSFTRNNLTALLYPEQRNLVVKIGSPSQAGRNGILAALTGSPVVTVPIGFSPPTNDAPIGVPIGMEIFGRPWEESKLLGIGWEMEKLFQIRKPPIWAEEVVEVTEFSQEKLEAFKPNRGNIPGVYSLGTL
ncbi:amidase signature enzyme [Aulographum hederae CBS 113979]|uniref:Amidase signature enzyme n=1 Tax=Aulographum hederae CBS 113979 TaxID=1176131 RepID=A0A6G1GQC9_9PEZI|nr:amidase signature enzyme [Aulographum hederae CBS 113979]